MKRARNVLGVFGGSTEDLDGIGRESEQSDIELHVEGDAIFGSSLTNRLSSEENDGK